MNTFKVCFVSLPATGLFFPKSKSDFSGAEVQLYLLAHELSKREQWKVSFIVENKKSGKALRENIEVNSFDSGAKKWRQIPVLRALPILQRLYKLLDRISPDMIIQRGASFATFGLYVYARLRRKKFVYMISHDWDTDGTKKRKMGINGWLFDFAMKRSDLIIAQTTKQQELMKKYMGKNIPIVSNGHRLYKVSKRSSYILAVTRLVSWKKPDLLLHLADRFPQEKFLFVGSKRGDPVLSQRFERGCAMRDNIDYREEVAFADNEQLYSQAKMLVTTSEAEGMPNVVLQAAAAAVPTVSLYLDPGDLMKKGIGLCANGDFEKMVVQVQTLLTTPSLRDSKGLAGRTMMHSNYSITQSGMNLERMLLSLL